MKDKVNGNSYERQLPQVEEQIAILYGVIGIGTHKVSMYQSTEMTEKRQMIFLFELTEDMMKIKEEEMPMTVINKVTRSMDERANLYKFIKNWRGTKFIENNEYIVWENLLKGAGMMTLINRKAKTSNKVYTNIENFTKIQKGVPLPDSMFHQAFFFDIEEEKPVWDNFLLMPKWLMKLVAKSSEWDYLLRAKKIPSKIISALDDTVPQNNSDEEEEESLINEKEKKKKISEEEEDDMFGSSSEDQGAKAPWEDEEDDDDDDFATV